MLKRIAAEEAGGILESKLANGNHRSAAMYGREVLTKAAADVVLERAIVFPVTRAKDVVGLRISPVRLWMRTRNCESSTTYHSVGTREQEATLENGGRSVNADNDWERIPECRLAGAMSISHADTGITGEV